MYSVYSAADFRPTSSATEVAWVDVPRPGFGPARGITPVSQADTFYVRLDTPPNAHSTKAMLMVKPASGSTFSAWLDLSLPTGVRLSGSAVFEPSASGQLITVEMFGYTTFGEASYLKFGLSPGEAVVGLLVRYSPGEGELVTSNPRRIYDSRQVDFPMVGGDERFIEVPVPWQFEGPHAAILNVTVTATTGNGFLAVYPPGTPWPGTSTLNWSAGQTVANGVQVGIGVGGNFGAPGVWLRFGGMGQAHVIVDLLGYYRPVDPAAGKLIGS